MLRTWCEVAMEMGPKPTNAVSIARNMLVSSERPNAACVAMSGEDACCDGEGEPVDTTEDKSKASRLLRQRIGALVLPAA